MKTPPIKKLYIDRMVIDEPLTALFRSRLRASVEIVENARQVFKQVLSSDDPIQKGKEVLYLTRNKGAFIRPCPGTQNYRCCDYMILHIGSYCVMDCSYCILQTYFHPPVLTFFVNQRDLMAELEAWLPRKTARRIGTGEFTDSMIWEARKSLIGTDLSRVLVPYFANQSYTALELKTKTVSIDSLEKPDHNRKTIMAWSLNTPAVIAHEERFTASLASRLKAAAKCAQWGYPLAFHFDPMVLYDGCEAEYRQVADLLFENIAPENIVWISLGAFRFIPALKPIIQKRFARSKIVYGEFITGLDNKMRYFKPLRINLYRQLISRIREYAPDVTLYFCMEDDEVWAKTLGYTPSECGGLPRILDSAAIRHCGLDN